MNRGASIAILLGLASAVPALAQPTITSLGSSLPTGISDGSGGTYYISTGGGRWTLTGSTLTFNSHGGGAAGGLISDNGQFVSGSVLNTGPQVLGNTAASVSPAFTDTPTLVPSTTRPGPGEFDAARWDYGTSTWKRTGGLPVVGSLHVFGSSSSGSSSGNFMSPNSMSRNGRFIVGQAYNCQYTNSTGNTISDNTFRWRPFIWDADALGGAGQVTVLPTPFRVNDNTWRRRTGAAFGVSNDGLVICGYQEHNVATTAGPDPDGARPVVWTWNSGTSSYDMTFLPGGDDGAGNFFTGSATAGSMHMNAAGTIIVGRSVDTAGNGFIAKWVWNSGTSSWDAPISLGGNLATPASWLPSSVTSCGVPPLLTPTGMTEDGSIVIGSARYSTCGSFMTGGFIWTASSGVITDWYDYNVSIGTPGVSATGPYAPVGDPTPGDGRGLPRLGSPLAISPDGNAITGAVLGPQFIPGAPGWIFQMTGGPACVPAAVSLNPSNATFSACSSNIIMNSFAMGTLPITYQWFKDGNPLVDGATTGGSVVTGATNFQLRVNPNLSAFDVGTYHAVVTGPCGAPASSASATASLDPAFLPATNDLCTGALPVTQGTNVLAPAQSPCGAYVMDTAGVSCYTGNLKTDLWYSFSPTTTQNYRLETCGANFDTVLSVFDSCGGAELACSEDYNSGPTTGCSATRSRISSITLNSGSTYLIRVAAPSPAFLSTTSTVNLSIFPAPVLPTNDDCSTPIPAVLGANPFLTTEATADNIFVLGCASSAHLSRDVWFSYTSAVSGRVVASTCPQGTAPVGYSLLSNTVLSAHPFQCTNESVCNDNHSPVPSGCGSQLSTLSVQVAAGTPMYFRVSGNSSTAHGAGQLNLNFICPADLDDGSGTGTPDGGVTIDDLLFFLDRFDAGSIAADLDDGSGTGTPDGGVTIDDLIFFLARFDAGC